MNGFEQRHAFRTFVRANHPDVGGDPELFVAGLARRHAVTRRNDARFDAPIQLVPDGWWATAVRRLRRRRNRPRVH